MLNKLLLVVLVASALSGCGSNPEPKSGAMKPGPGLNKGPEFGKTPPKHVNDPKVASKAVGKWKVELAPATLKSFAMQKRAFISANFEFNKDGTFTNELTIADEKNQKLILFQKGKYRGEGESIYTIIEEMGARTADGKNEGSRRTEGTTEVPYKFAKSDTQLEAFDGSATLYKK